MKGLGLVEGGTTRKYCGEAVSAELLQLVVEGISNEFERPEVGQLTELRWDVRDAVIGCVEQGQAGEVFNEGGNLNEPISFQIE